jgi:thioredoxin reductase (NADPH)
LAAPTAPSIERAFAKLTDSELRLVQSIGTIDSFDHNACVFQAGQRRLDLLIVLDGGIEIVNPMDSNRSIVVHDRGSFVGDIDLITGRPVIVSAFARGATTAVRIPFDKIRMLLNRVPSFGEKLMVGFTSRRERISLARSLGVQVMGPNHCKQTNLAREFLHKNFVPYTWHAPESEEGQSLARLSQTNGLSPVIQLTDQRLLVDPSLRQLAEACGAWQPYVEGHRQLAIIGAGPAGIAAAVYAASEGIKTLLIDRMGPGGQAGGSSKIENFIGFPAGLSGTELATRGILQMLKFGAEMATPTSVEQIIPLEGNRPGSRLMLDSGGSVTADVVLVATGVHWRRLEATEAARFEGAGLHYVCTTVEAHLYDGRDVAVVGGGNSAGQAAMYLAECCTDRTVHLMVRSSFGAGMSRYLSSRILATPNIVVHSQSQIVALRGGDQLESIDAQTYSSTASTTPPQTCTIDCAAVFAFIGAEPAAAWLPTQIARDPSGYLLTGMDLLRQNQWPLKERDPTPLETSQPFVLAAGDIRSGSTKRVGFAVGDGSMAITCTHRLLATIEQLAGEGS